MGNTCAIGSEYLDWMPLAYGMVLTLLLGLSIGFMVSRAMGRRDWESTIKIELYHLLSVVVWLVIINAIASTACVGSCIITKDENPFGTATSYLSDLRGTLETNINNLFSIAKDIRTKSAIMLQLLNAFVSPWTGCTAVADNYERFAIMMSPITGSLIVQQYALIIINNIAFQLLLPLGVILRIIPPLRESGAFVMALALALYIVFPLTYVFAMIATQGLSSSEISATSVGTNTAGLGTDCTDLKDILPIFRAVGNGLPQAIFFPSLSMIITLGAARAMSKVFSHDFLEPSQ
jgi:hypothetical protein